MLINLSFSINFYHPKDPCELPQRLCCWSVVFLMMVGNNLDRLLIVMTLPHMGNLFVFIISTLQLIILAFFSLSIDFHKAAKLPQELHDIFTAIPYAHTKAIPVPFKQRYIKKSREISFVVNLR